MRGFEGPRELHSDLLTRGKIDRWNHKSKHLGSCHSKPQLLTLSQLARTSDQERMEESPRRKPGAKPSHDIATRLLPLVYARRDH